MPVAKKKETTAKNKGGRPTKYSKELAEEICRLIREGESDSTISKRLGMPNKSTISAWRTTHPEFCEQSARARELSAAVWRERAMNEAAEVSAKAEKALKGELIVGDEPCYELPRTYLEAKKILIQELNREAALRDDANFGDRKKVDLSGSVKHEVTESFDLSGLSTEQLEQLDDLLKNAETA